MAKDSPKCVACQQPIPKDSLCERCVSATVVDLKAAVATIEKLVRQALKGGAR